MEEEHCVEEELLIGNNNTITGQQNKDNLVGGQTNQTIIGNQGNDLIIGDTTLGDNLLINGSFDNHGSLNNGSFGYFRSIDGWNRSGSALIELQNGNLFGGDTAKEDTVVELDSNGNSAIYQKISDISAGSLYTISFDFSARPGVAADSNTMEVWWSGKIIDTITLDGIGQSGLAFKTFTYTVEASTSSNWIGFKSVGKQDTLGAILNEVAVQEVIQDEDSEIGGNDMLIGGEGADELHGNGGRDWLDGGEGADALYGGQGVDTAYYAKAESAVTVHLGTGKGTKGDARGDTYDSIENVHGSDFNDSIKGDNNDNRLVGRDGKDSISAGGGDDTLLGGRGADKLDGGSGRDAAEYDWSTEGVTVNLTTGRGEGGYAEGDSLRRIEDVRGSDHDDVLIGDKNVNRLVGGDGNDVLNGMAGNDILVGGHGADTLIGGEGVRDAADYQGSHVGVGVDLAKGGYAGFATGDKYDGVEFVYGSEFNDTISGDDAINRLVGKDGDDDLSGAGGNDYILGGLGKDTLTGGEGDDVFLFEAAFGNDTITDFEYGAGRTDRIWFKGLDLSEEKVDVVQTDSGAQINAAEFGTLLLQGVNVADLHSDDFIF